MTISGPGVIEIQRQNSEVPVLNKGAGGQ